MKRLLNIKTPSRAPPDLTAILDGEEGKDCPLSADAHAKLRTGLGKIVWLQSRQDIRAFVSLIATQQSSPHEQNWGCPTGAT